MRKLLVALSIIGITSGMAYSNGFQINEQGAKALAWVELLWLRRTTHQQYTSTQQG
ncbi:hypothetical protein [Calditerrivibrio nitroreducens]|uniref:hypothetical protein n=1 Tax=Calditerrivibrio nitroreducens TaxID=477976 RepID=UPI003C712332